MYESVPLGSRHSKLLIANTGREIQLREAEGLQAVIAVFVIGLCSLILWAVLVGFVGWVAFFVT